MTIRVLITGATGFIGHHVVEHLLDTTDWELVGLDRIDATSTTERLKAIPSWSERSKRVKFIWHDLRAAVNQLVDRQIGRRIDVVLHLAASTHVDRSIADPMGFVLDNVVGTTNLLEWMRRRDQAPHFFNFSTDEVFGPAPTGTAYKEHDRYNSGNPYAASKAGAEEMCAAFANTYGLPIYTTHTMNVVGERQHPEKFLPMVIAKLNSGELIQVHANRDRTKAGSRFYIYAKNVAFALKFLVEKAFTGDLVRGDKFNIVGEREIDNEELVLEIAQRLGVVQPNYELVDYHSSRPGHDLRYALDGAKLEAMGCVYPYNLNTALDNIVRWYLANRSWLLV